MASSSFVLPGWYLGKVPVEHKKKAANWPLEPTAATIRIEHVGGGVVVVFEVGTTVHSSQARFIEPVDDSARFFTARVDDEPVGFAFTTREESAQFMHALSEQLKPEAGAPLPAPELPPARSSLVGASANSNGPVERVCLLIFFLEGFINVFSGLFIMAYPQHCLALFGVDAAPQTQDIFRWFGSLTVLLGYIGLRSPVSVQNIEGLLLGDLLYLVVWYHFITQYGAMNFWSVWPAGILVVFLALSRTIFLLVRSRQQKKHKQKLQ